MLFQYSTQPVYERMWSAMNSFQPSAFVRSAAEGVERVRNSNGKYAFLLESNMNDWFNQLKPCDTIRVGQLLDARGYGIAMKIGSPLRSGAQLGVA